MNIFLIILLTLIAVFVIFILALVLTFYCICRHVDRNPHADKEVEWKEGFDD